MLYHREGLPQEDEIVLCKVARIEFTSVFVELLEYKHTGLVHISEIAPGRIRNIRDYVSVGRQIVCLILRVDSRTNNISLSLRRVNTHQRTEKLEQLKQELKAESLIKSICEKLKKPLAETYNQIFKKVSVEYPLLYPCFRDVSTGEADLGKLGIDKDIAKELTALIVEKFKPPKIVIKGEIKLQTYAPDGVDKVRNLLLSLKKISPTLTITYLGGGRYQLSLEDIDYKPAEANLRKVEELIEEFNNKVSEASFEREKTE